MRPIWTLLLGGLSLVHGDSLSVCSANPGQVDVDVVTSVIYSPLVISAFVPSPTTITVNEHISMTVTACPTTIITTTFYSTTVVETITRNASFPIQSTAPPSTVTEYVPGTTPGTSTIPPNGTTPGTVRITTPTPSGTALVDGPPPYTPTPSTDTEYVPGTTPGTSTIPPNGTTPGTLRITTPSPSGTAATRVDGPPPFTPSTTPPGNVTDYTPGPTPGTSYISPSGTDPGTIEITTPTPMPTSSTTPPGNVTDYTPGPTPGTTTIPPNGTTSGTVIITTPTPGPTFTCDAGGYLIQDHTLYRLNLSTGVETQVNALVGNGAEVNALGYNVLDNYLYAIENATVGPGGSHPILRIADNGASQTIGYVNGSFEWNVGDIDTNGHFWISMGGKEWAEVDVDPESSTYGQTLANGTSAQFDGKTIYDWAYLPAEGPYLYALTAGPNVSLVEWDMNTHQYTFLENYGDITGTGKNLFGALYASSNATLYGSENNSGDIYEFPIPSGTPSRVSDGPASSLNDGARCVYAADPGAVPT